MVLRDCDEALVEEELEACVVRLDDERTSPQIGPLVSDGEDQPDELALISRQCLMARSDGATEERDGAVVLMEHRAEPRARSIAFHDERLGEVR